MPSTVCFGVLVVMWCEAPPPPAPVVVCPPVVEYDRAFVRRAGEDAARAGPELRQILADAKRMRDQVRTACRPGGKRS